MVTADYIVVGSGVTGATVARVLSDAGKDVIVVERRNHIGGNVHDHLHPSGIRMHTYGPHFFRTNSVRLWEYVQRFSAFNPYEAVVKSLVNGRYENWPISKAYLSRCAPGWHAEGLGNPCNFEEACLRQMPLSIYEKFVKGYTEKQWGVPARLLDKQLAGRVEVREDDEPRFSRHRFQGIPRNGYTSFVSRMLLGIPVLLNVDFLTARQDFCAQKMLIFTGPVDELFDYEFGRLSYRSQRREHEFIERRDLVQPCVTVNNPDPGNGEHIRTIEWKHMMPKEDSNCIRGTLLTREIPFSPMRSDHCEYPFPDYANARLHRKYAEKAANISGLLVCGRLGEYKYYDMDQAIGRALVLGQRLLKTSEVPAIPQKLPRW